MFPIEPIKYDCRHYTGYKPCGKNGTCEDCPFHSPQGKRVLVVQLQPNPNLNPDKILRDLKIPNESSHITWVAAPEVLKDLQSYR